MISLNGIHKSYEMGSNSLHVLKGINLEIEQGEFVSIMGSSGSGKSTLLNILGILDNYDEGSYHLNGNLDKKHVGKASCKVTQRITGICFPVFQPHFV